MYMEKKKILVIDDEEAILDMLKQGLELRSTYDVSIASEVAEYKNLLFEKSFDVIFLDHRMPVIKGANLAVDIRDSEGQIKIRLLFFFGVYKGSQKSC